MYRKYKARFCLGRTFCYRFTLTSFRMGYERSGCNSMRLGGGGNNIGLTDYGGREAGPTEPNTYLLTRQDVWLGDIVFEDTHALRLREPATTL